MEYRIEKVEIHYTGDVYYNIQQRKCKFWFWRNYYTGTGGIKWTLLRHPEDYFYSRAEADAALRNIIRNDDSFCEHTVIEHIDRNSKR